jgi:NAD(P)-dependent dehydrogenase (short-subunit alcohol dehydrogenase family)
MNLQINKRSALVTGSTKGIGFEIAKALVGAGCRVVVHGRDQADTERVAATISDPASVIPVAADLSTAAGAKELVDRSVAAFGSIDILINNAGFFETRPFDETTDAHWQSMFDINVMSGVRLSQRMLPGMLSRGWGRVVFIASEAGVKPWPEMLHYSTSKAAQIAIARGLSEMTRGTQVTVNSVLVAPTWTEGVESFLGRIAEQTNASIDTVKRNFFDGPGRNSLLGQFANAADIASVVAFLCSEQARVINGAAQRADGGIYQSV